MHFRIHYVQSAFGCYSNQTEYYRQKDEIQTVLGIRIGNTQTKVERLCLCLAMKSHEQAKLKCHYIIGT